MPATWLTRTSRLVREARFEALLLELMPPSKVDILLEALRNYFSADRNPHADGNYWDDFAKPGLTLHLDELGPRFTQDAAKQAALTARLLEVFNGDTGD
jgi:hypothetical protein